MPEAILYNTASNLDTDILEHPLFAHFVEDIVLFLME